MRVKNWSDLSYYLFLYLVLIWLISPLISSIFQSILCDRGLCIEGFDVATNLKWAMSSNSLCLTTKMLYETWFMEGKLEAGKHYVQLEDDYSDLEEKILYYSKHTKEAEEIISNAHQYVSQFQNQQREDVISLLVLNKYFELSGQAPTNNF